MRSNYTRHLSRFINPRTEEVEQKGILKSARGSIKEAEVPSGGSSCGEIDIPAEFNPKDWLSFLLHIDAELEHGLMVQYLYGAYSLGGDQVPERYREAVKNWQEVVLGIAKEEMGHFVSVQNVLRVLGAPLNFARQDFPWDTELYPFPFKLEPFTKKSLAKYIYAESPPGWINEENDPTGIRKNIASELLDDLSIDYLKSLPGKMKDLVENFVKEHKVGKDSITSRETKIADEIRENEAKDEIRDELMNVPLGDPIGCIFEQILNILNDSELIPDSTFQPETYPYQAKFDEWGRGYRGGARGNSTGGHPGTPDVLVAPLLSRTDTINAVSEIAEQGEGTSPEMEQPSHFERFLGIYEEWMEIEAETQNPFEPAREVATNPTIAGAAEDPTSSPADGQIADQQIDMITNEISKEWAALFNIRYRMLLNFLNHSFLLDDGLNNSGAYTPRGTIVHATFGEMYNLRSLSHILMKKPLNDLPGDTRTAGPPFTVPYTMDLPIGEKSRWIMHNDLLQASSESIDRLLLNADPTEAKYLNSVKESDENLKSIADEIIHAAH